MTKNRNLLAILLFAFILRILAIFLFGYDKISFGDAQDYLNTASHLCTDHAYPEHGNLPFFRAPLLPAYIALVTFCHPDKIGLLKITFAIMDCLTVFLIFQIGGTLKKCGKREKRRVS